MNCHADAAESKVAEQVAKLKGQLQAKEKQLLASETALAKAVTEIAALKAVASQQAANLGLKLKEKELELHQAHVTELASAQKLGFDRAMASMKAFKDPMK